MPGTAAMLMAQGVWDPKTMVNVEELDPEPFIAILDKIGLPTDVKEIKPSGKDSFDGTVRDLKQELGAVNGDSHGLRGQPYDRLDAQTLRRTREEIRESRTKKLIR